MHHHHDDARQGHLASNRVSGVHGRRRLRHAGNGRCCRCPDAGRSLELSRSAMGICHRLAAVRPLFRRRSAGAIRDPASVQIGARDAEPARLRLRRGARSRMPYLQARRRQNVTRGCRPAGATSFSEPAVARVPIPDRATLRPDGAGARDYQARHHGAEPAAVDRSRSNSAPASANSPSSPPWA